MQESTIPDQLKSQSLLHFESGVPINDLDLRKEQKMRLARVSHVYWLWMRNPMLDHLQMFKELIRGKYADASAACHAAQKDNQLFEYVINHLVPSSRRISEARVRHAANKLIEMGMQTDNGRDIADGAKILMKVDRLDQPESEQADMAHAAFMPTIVVTDIKQVDDTKENIDDEEMKRIIAKYGGFVDEKHQAIEEQVELMESRRLPDANNQKTEENVTE